MAAFTRPEQSAIRKPGPKPQAVTAGDAPTARQYQPALNSASWNFAAIPVSSAPRSIRRKPLPNKQAMEETEKALYDTYVRDCNDVNVLQRLDREDPITPTEKVRRLEDRIKFIRHYFRVKATLSDPVEHAQFRCVVDCIFGKGYALTSEEAALAATQCELSETQWKSFALARHGHIPGGGRSLSSDKVPWIPDPKVCFNADKMEELKKSILAGKGCEGQSGKAEPVVF
jgi:hypothetical protein